MIASSRSDAMQRRRSLTNSSRPSARIAHNAEQYNTVSTPYSSQTSHTLPGAALPVFAIDAVDLFLHGFEQLAHVEPDLHVVGKFCSGSDAVHHAIGLCPKVIVMSLRIKWTCEDEPTPQAGIQTLQALAHKCPYIPVLTLIGHDQSRWIPQIMRAGAKGIVHRDAQVEEILSAIRMLHMGCMAFKAEHMDSLHGADDLLTSREQEVLSLLAKGLSNAVIAESLSIQVGTARKHVENIRKKLNASNRMEAVILALRQGWL